MTGNQSFAPTFFHRISRNAILLAIVALAIGLRLNNLLPPERGLRFAADADEGIYAASARLALDGFVPYRDYFCSAPPLALYLFMAVLAPSSPPWGNTAGFMALRYVSVAYGITTLLAVYAIGARLGGKPAGLLAAALLAADGWAVAQDRRAMLEAPMSMFSALALLTFIVAQHQIERKQRWYLAAAILAGMAILTKTQGAVALLAILLTLLLQHRWRSAIFIFGIAAATYLAFSLPFLLLAGDDFVRQLFFFQFLRPPNGDPALILRVNAIRNYAESWLTVRLGLLGAALLFLRWLFRPVATLITSIVSSAPGRQRPKSPNSTGGPEPLSHPESSHPLDAWLPVFLWAGMVAASFVASRTFYLYYYAQLAAPLALLGGSLVHPWRSSEQTLHQRSEPSSNQISVSRLAIGTLLIVLAVWRLPTQIEATMGATGWVKDAYVDIGRHLQEGAPTANVLGFEPNYAFLASRPIAHLADGTFFVDSHADMIYRNLGIKSTAWPELIRRLARRDITDEQTLLWQQPAQDTVRVALADAHYVIIDRRARYLCTPDTIQQLEDATVQVAVSGDVVLRMKP